MSAVIAHREIGCGGAAGLISVEAPQPDQNDWRCDYEISWPGMKKRSYAMGIDSFQALQLAMRRVATDVGCSDDFKAGRISGFGEPLTTLDELNQFFGVTRQTGPNP